MKDQLREIKQRFFAFRNGILADALRKQYPYGVIFGLQIPQIAEIARSLTPSLDLARSLWADENVRESRILATYLFPPEETDMATALSLASAIKTVEEADMLAFRLLKRLPFASQLREAMESRNDISEYMKKTLDNHLGL